ncbi:N-alpha-acetyltransferase, non-catalitic subunit [Coemansia sp. BCRC 34962]|nr:N-alpha-acetyltransferase, non-catalitic subunit [Coemansia sp. BCRC 34962]
MPDGAELARMDGDDWLDITTLIREGAQSLGSGEMIKPESLSLLDAMTSVQVMDPRLDMGMLSAADLAEITQWDIDRPLSLSDTLWVVNRLFCCEMTWHNSASLLQTIYTCNYYTTDDPPATIGMSSSTNRERDLVLYPLVVATGLCCRRVWDEYLRENVYSEEDVLLGSAVVKFFDDRFSLSDALGMLDAAQAYLATQQGAEADMLAAHVSMRRRWLRVLSSLFAEYLSEDPSALDRSMDELEALQKEHDAYRSAFAEHIARAARDGVPGVFDIKCMRKFPSLAPIKPRSLLALAEAHGAMASLVSGLLLVRTLLGLESVESLVYFFQGVSRQGGLLPFVRSLLISVFAGDGLVLLTQPVSDFVRRAISEMGGQVEEGGERVDLFCMEAARMLVDWFRTLCQNAPRQRRIALKYVAGWDSLQAEAEQLDIWIYSQQQHASEEEASDPSCNPFWLSSWVYHMKLVLMGGGLMAGVRLDVYLDYEFPMVFCYAAQIFEAHQLHLSRMLGMASTAQAVDDRLWTRRRVSGTESREQLERWLAIVAAQKDLATALWLVSHACERLGLFRAPWAKGRASRLALAVWQRQETLPTQEARFALRFRAFSRLNSPTPLAFANWVATRDQLDAHPIGDLFSHAARVLADAKATMDQSRRKFGPGSDEAFRSLYYVVVANSVALAKVPPSDVLGSPALAATGSQAAVFREALLSEAVADAELSSGDLTKAKAKREKKKRAARNDVAKGAREWQAHVDRLASSGVLKVAWSTAAERHPDWPLFSFT